MRILGIETSCDDTACAIINDEKQILSNVLSSQIPFHAKYGGIVPEIASRKHLELISTVCNEALEQAGVTWKEIDLIAVTKGPGLVGSLLVGVEYAKGLSLALHKPIKGMNHMEGHLLSPMITEKIPYPFLGLIVSGGHTEFIRCEKPGQYEEISSTVDDSCGEALDKFGKLLGIDYPAGPMIEKLAKKGNSHAYKFPLPVVRNHPLHLSFSGLKTAAMNIIRTLSDKQIEAEKENLCASYQYALFRHLYSSAQKVIQQCSVDALTISGGVSANETLYEMLKEQVPIPVYKPPRYLSTDNAVMVAFAGYTRFMEEGEDALDFAISSQLPWISYGLHS